MPVGGEQGVRATDCLPLAPAALVLAGAAASLIWNFDPFVLWPILSLLSLAALVAYVLIRDRRRRQGSAPPPM